MSSLQVSRDRKASGRQDVLTTQVFAVIARILRQDVRGASEVAPRRSTQDGEVETMVARGAFWFGG